MHAHIVDVYEHIEVQIQAWACVYIYIVCVCILTRVLGMLWSYKQQAAYRVVLWTLLVNEGCVIVFCDCLADLQCKE